MAFTLKSNPYSSVDAWAADRGQQLRDYFGIARDDLRPDGVGKPAQMSDVEWNNRKILTLAPVFRERFVEFMFAVESVAGARGIDMIIWDAVRSLERQLVLYKRGRVPVADKSKQVTKIIISRRGHIFGLAVDLCVRSAAGQPIFDLPKWYVADILPLAKPYGLESLFLTKKLDRPHIQLPLQDAPPDCRSAAEQILADFPGVSR